MTIAATRKALVFLVQRGWRAVFYFRPVLIGFVEVARDIALPSNGNVLIDVQVKLVIHDLPDIWITVELLAQRDAHGAETAILWQVAVWISHESLHIAGACEIVGAASVLYRVFLLAFFRATCSEVRNWIIPMHCEAVHVGIHFRC